MKKLKYIAYSALLVLFALSTSACASKSVVYKEVKVPVKCDVPKRERTKFDTSKLSEEFVEGNPLEGLTYLVEEVYPAIFQYLEGIERDLAYCRGETK